MVASVMRVNTKPNLYVRIRNEISIWIHWIQIGDPPDPGLLAAHVDVPMVTALVVLAGLRALVRTVLLLGDPDRPRLLRIVVVFEVRAHGVVNGVHHGCRTGLPVALVVGGLPRFLRRARLVRSDADLVVDVLDPG